MSDKLLVAYATRYGTTREVAEEIAATLREASSVADAQSAEHARTLAGYRAVVVGAPLYMYNRLKEARSFLSRHRAALEKMPVSDIRDWEAVRAWATGLVEMLA